MSIKQARIEGGKTFREQWGPSLLALLLAAAGMIAATVAVLGVGALIVEGPILVGVYYVYYQAIQGNKIVYKDMLYGFKTNFGEIVLGNLIKQAFFAGVGIACYLLISSFLAIVALLPILGIILIVLAAIAAIVALIIFALYLAAVEYILMREPEAKGWEAVKKSKRIMSGNTGRYFGFCLSFIGWFILTAIFFPLAIYTAPYFYMSKMYFIGSIYDEAERRANEPVYTVPETPAFFEAAAPAADTAVKYCKHCGSPLPMEAAFCSKCGGEQGEKTAEPVQEAVPEPAAEVQEAVAEETAEIKETLAEVKETLAEAKEELTETAGTADEITEE